MRGWWGAAAEIPGYYPIIVDAKQLVERRICLIIQGFEG
jgi:hypothetical protein